MDDPEAGRYWDANADVWTRLSRAGYDVYRDLINSPAFFAALPDVAGLRGLDIGCGEGHNTRALRERGAAVVAIDISPRFVRLARDAEPEGPTAIRFAIASGQALPFAESTFHFATAFMSLMDMPRPEVALREVRRVLRPSGFLQFSILHPCGFTPHRKQKKTEGGRVLAIETAGYFDPPEGHIDEWLFSAAPREVKQGLPPFRVPAFYRTLAFWLNAVIRAGLQIEYVEEPHADLSTAEKHPVVADTRIAPYFLHVRCRRM